MKKSVVFLFGLMSFVALPVVAQNSAMRVSEQNASPEAVVAPVVPETSPQVVPAPTPTPEIRRAPRKKKNPIEKFVGRLQLGVGARYFRYVSGKTREQFGDGGWSLRPSYYKLRTPREKKSLRPNFSLTRLKSDDNRLTMVTLGMEYRYFFNMPDRPNTTEDEEDEDDVKIPAGGPRGFPYVGMSLNLTPAKLRIPAEGIDSGLKLGVGTTLVAGYQYKTRLRAEISGTALTSIAGYNFSSIRFGTNLKF